MPWIRTLVGVTLVSGLALGQTPFLPADQAGVPTFQLVLRRPLARAVVEQTIDRNETFNERSRRVVTCGTGETSADVTMDFVPCDRAAVFDLVLKGRTTSRTVTGTRSVRLYNSNLTTYTARARLVIDETGIRSLPARAVAGQETDLEGITTTLRFPADPLVRRLTYRVYNRVRDSALEAVAEKAATMVAGGMDQEIQSQLPSANRSFQEKFVAPLRKHGIYPESLRFSTDPETVYVRARLADAGVAVAPPPAGEPAAALSVAVHESFLNAAAGRLFGGKTFTPESFQQEFADLGGPLGPSAKPTPKEAGRGLQEMTFARVAPIGFRFQDGKVTITLRTTGFRLDRDEYKGWNLSATYALRAGEDEWVAVRQGPVEAVLQDSIPGKESASELYMRRVLVRRFAEVFRERIALGAVSLPAGTGKTIRLAVEPVRTADGWLVLSYRLPGT
jgi:hypothetical protein